MPRFHPSDSVIRDIRDPGPVGEVGKASGVQSLMKFEELSSEQAEVLVAGQLSLHMDNLRQVPPRLAQVLMRCRYEIHMPSLTTITEEAAFWLGAAPMLYLTGLQRISSKVAGRLRKARIWLDLGGLHHLSAAAARELAKTRAWLSLRGLDQLSPELAHALASHEGGGLSLRGLRSISPEVAEILSQHRGGVLRLTSLKNAPESIRGILRKHRGGVCYQ